MQRYILTAILSLLVVMVSAGCPQSPREIPADDIDQTPPAQSETGTDSTSSQDGGAQATGKETAVAAGNTNPDAIDAGTVVDSLFEQRSAIKHEMELLRASPNPQPELLAQSENKLQAINDQLLKLAEQDRDGLLAQLQNLSATDPELAGEWTTLIEQGAPGLTAGATETSIALAGKPYTGPPVQIDELRGKLKEIWEVEFTTTFGNFTLEVYPELAPVHGIRFLELVEAGFYDNMHIPRIEPGWVVQWGSLYDLRNAAALRPDTEPPVYPRYQDRKTLVISLKDEPVRFPNTAWTVAFGKNGPDSATVEPFINLQDNTQLDSYNPPFSPFAYVTEGRDNIERLVSAFNSAMDSAKADLRADLEARNASADFIEREVQNEVLWRPYVDRYWDPFTVALITEARIIQRPQ